jgi:hypothetical protein
MNKAYDSVSWRGHRFSEKIEVEPNSRIDQCAHRGSGHYVENTASVRPYSWDDALFS